MDDRQSDLHPVSHAPQPSDESGIVDRENSPESSDLPVSSSVDRGVRPADEPKSIPRSASESEQKTIISKSPPDALPHLTRTGVQDLGRILVGEQLGHFVLEEFVGGGGMGAVFRATDIELGRTVALKVVSGVHNDDDTLRRFKNEAQSAARLDHHNIARVYYVGEDKGWHYIVFEFISGVNIRDLVEHRGPLPLDEAIYYTLQVSEALEHASQRDVVHRDIKPSNVLVMQDGKVKLVDMGLARLHQVESAADELTASGVTLGTFDYISPEQARDPRSADVRSDLYSLGCTLYYMLTGRPPFPEGTVLQKLFSHSLDAPPDPRDLRPDLPDDVTQVVHKLLAKNPLERFQTPAELMMRLLRMADDLQLSLAGRPATVYVESERRPLTRFDVHLPWLIPAALLILIVLMLESLSTPQAFTVTHPELPSRVVQARPAPRQESLAESSVADETRDLAPQNGMAPADGPAEDLSSSLPSETVAGDSELSRRDSELPFPSTPFQTTDLFRIPGDMDDLIGVFGPDASSFVLQPPLVSADFSEPVPDDPALTLEPSPGAEAMESSRLPSSPLDPPSRIIVGANIERPPVDAIVVTSLASAVQRASENPRIDTIELWFNDELSESPLQVVAKERLRFKAASGYRPIVRFRPKVGGYGTTRRMLELSGGNTIWEGVHFRLELPTEPSEGWALFGLRSIESLELRNCTLTIQNMDENGIEWQNGAAFFQFDAPQVSSRMDMGMDIDSEDPGMNPMPVLPDPPALRLHDCAVRGQATLIRADLAFPLTVFWRQGLLACNERFFVFGGAADSTARDAQIKIELQKVTAVVEEGFGLMALDGRGPLLIQLDISLTECIVAMNESVPLLEHRGTSVADRVERSLVLGGRQNFYPVRHPPTTPFLPPSPQRIRWRILTASGDRIEFPFDQTGRDWYQEEGFDVTVPWRSPLPPGLPFHRHTLGNYGVIPRPGNLAHTSGFDADAVPEFPDAVPAPLLPLGNDLFSPVEN
jgi:eukaryotic-like serine/threonine-protein kinase